MKKILSIFVLVLCSVVAMAQSANMMSMARAELSKRGLSESEVRERLLANGIDADKLAQLQEIQREACYYWNLPAADNSEGAHNQKLYTACLDKLEELLNQGDEILGVTSSAADFEAWNAAQAQA